MTDTSPAYDPNELVVVRHPDGQSAGVCTRHQLKEVWAEKGFEIDESLKPEDVIGQDTDAAAPAETTTTTASPTTTTTTAPPPPPLGGSGSGTTPPAP